MTSRDLRVGGPSRTDRIHQAAHREFRLHGDRSRRARDGWPPAAGGGGRLPVATSSNSAITNTGGRMRAVQIRTFGEPGIVLELADLPEPPAPAAGEVLIGVEHAPINMNDLYLIQRVYPVRPSLPSVVGNEGVGRVLAIGRGVDHLKVGDRVLVPLYSFSWRERLVAPAAGLFALPGGAPRQPAMLGINPPTAALLRNESVDLRPGDWVAQNAANSGVGRSLIAIAKARGLKTINFVRRPELVPELQAVGGDLLFAHQRGGP